MSVTSTPQVVYLKRYRVKSDMVDDRKVERVRKRLLREP